MLVLLFYVKMIMDFECALHEVLIGMLNVNFWTLWFFLENPDEDLHDLHLRPSYVLHVSRMPAVFATDFLG